MIPAAWLAAAAKIAIATWGAPHCGHVHQRVFNRLPPGEPANTAAWSYVGYPRGARNHCTIGYYGPDRIPWVWWRVCAATVHEWGHLTGHRHSRDPASPMFPVLHPIRQCPASRSAPSQGKADRHPGRRAGA